MEQFLDIPSGHVSADRWEWQYRQLAEQDAVMAGLLDACGMPDPFLWSSAGQTTSGRARESNFAAMVLHIIGQQVSMASAAATYDRLVRLLTEAPTADGILALTPERMREAGISRQKAGYLLDLAERQASNAVDLEHMSGLDDVDAMELLVSIRGVGQWTAEMFLMHQLQRRDILPAGDLGIRRGVQHAYHLDALPAVEEVRERGALWAPYRTFASELLWGAAREVSSATR